MRPLQVVPRVNLIPFDTRGAWSRYTTADGLGSQQTEHIVEDADGYLWIATISGGVCRFDGESFRTYTTRDGLPSDDVYALCIDRFGRLWCGTLAGLCWLDGERFRPAEAVPAMHVNFLFEDSRGWLWTGGGFDGTCFGFWDGESYTDLSKDYESTTGSGGGACWGLCEDQDGAVWLAARHVARWDGGTLEHIDLPHHHNHTIAAHPGGGVWHASGGSIGTWRDGTYESLEIPLASSVRKILPDRQGRVWFCLTATGQDAPVALLADGQSFLQVAASQVGFNYVNAMHEDREGALWFATWGGGVTRFDPAGPFVLDTADGLPSKQVARVAEDAHRRLWVQFSDPMVSNKEWPVGYLADDCFVALPDTEQYQTDLLVTGDGIWLTGKGGLCRWALDSLKPVDVVLGSETRRRYTGCLSRDSQGRLLLGYSDRPPEGVDTLVIACFDAGETQTLLEVATPGRLVARDQGAHGAK